MFYKISSLLVGVAFLFLIFKNGIIPIAYVNSEPITLTQFVLGLRGRDPDNVLNNLITERIIMLEAKKRNIEVTAEEVQEEIDYLTTQSAENLKIIADLYGERDELSQEAVEKVKLRVTVYKILEQDLEVTEEDIEQYFYENREFYEGQEYENVQEEIKRMLLSQEYEEWIRQAYAKNDVDYIIKF